MDIAAIITTIAIIGLMGVMLAMGTTLRMPDFQRVIQQPRALLLGLTGQMVLLPSVAFGLGLALNLSAPVAVGLIVIASCAGGAPSNAVCAIAKGDVALSVTMTAISSMVAFLTVPVFVSFGVVHYYGEGSSLQLPFWETAARIFLTTFLPVAGGMALGRFAPRIAEAIRRPLFLGGFGVVLITSCFFLISRVEMLTSMEALSAVVVFNLMMMVLAYSLGRAMRLNEAEVRSVTVEIGMPNISMSIVVIMGILNAPELIGPTFFFLPLAYVTGLGFAFLVRRFRAPLLA